MLAEEQARSLRRRVELTTRSEFTEVAKMMSLVRIAAPRRKNRWFTELLFLVMTVGPWVLMTWMLWPRR